METCLLTPFGSAVFDTIHTYAQLPAFYLIGLLWRNIMILFWLDLESFEKKKGSSCCRSSLYELLERVACRGSSFPRCMFYVLRRECSESICVPGTVENSYVC